LVHSRPTAGQVGHGLRAELRSRKKMGTSNRQPGHGARNGHCAHCVILAHQNRQGEGCVVPGSASIQTSCNKLSIGAGDLPLHFGAAKYDVYVLGVTSRLGSRAMKAWRTIAARLADPPGSHFLPSSWNNNPRWANTIRWPGLGKTANWMSHRLRFRSGHSSRRVWILADERDTQAWPRPLLYPSPLP